MGALVAMGALKCVWAVPGAGGEPSKGPWRPVSPTTALGCGVWSGVFLVCTPDLELL